MKIKWEKQEMKRNHYYMFIKHVKHVLQQNSLPLYSVSNSNTKQLRVKTESENIISDSVGGSYSVAPPVGWD